MTFESPEIFVATARELHLSNQDMIVLMQEVLSQGKEFRFRVKGASMMPFIRDGDVITIAPKIDDNYSVGDVIAFISPVSGNLIVHRIITKKQKGFLIRGDGIADHPDGRIPLEKILGQITGVERNERRVRFGFGPERYIVAWLSQLGVLVPLLNILEVWRKKLKESLSAK